MNTSPAFRAFIFWTTFAVIIFSILIVTYYQLLRYERHRSVPSSSALFHFPC